MAYYIRVLAQKNTNISVSQIQGWLKAAGLKNVSVVAEDGAPASWRQITLKRERSKELVTIERNLVEPDSLGEEEIQEFLSELADSKPKSAADWLAQYLPTVQMIYAFQILFSSDKSDDWQPVHLVQGKIWETAGGILQADYEGFSNEDGYHILWQFSDGVTGPWNMAILTKSGVWQAFEMDLGNLEHRRAFQEGRIPIGVKLL